MPLSRRLIFGLPLLLAATQVGAAADSAGAPAVIRQFYAELLAVMQAAKGLGFDQRYARLAPEIGRCFDLAAMTRIAVGPGWAQIAAPDQARLTDAFSRYTISVYANRFDGYDGERFEVDPAATAGPVGAVVASRLVKSNGEKVVLNYLMRQEGGAWKVIDVYLSGTISELATRRSEFHTVLQQGGADGLVRMLERRSAELRTG